MARNKVSQALENVLLLVVARNDVGRNSYAALLSCANYISEGVLVLVLKPNSFSVSQIAGLFHSKNLFKKLIDCFESWQLN